MAPRVRKKLSKNYLHKKLKILRILNANRSMMNNKSVQIVHLTKTKTIIKNSKMKIKILKKENSYNRKENNK